mgnify:CR=1 FL=1
MKLAFTDDESMEANEEWGANCGPHALAAALGYTLAQVRPLFAPKFEQMFRERGYGFTNPTMMGNAIALAGVWASISKNLRTKEVCEGVNRIQWEGRWLNPGVPPMAAYAHTHWVAATHTYVFCTAVPCFEFLGGRRWLTLREWQDLLRVLCVREKFTGWHVTHHYKFLIGDEAQ